VEGGHLRPPSTPAERIPLYLVGIFIFP
jgi:hypothetical protein